MRIIRKLSRTIESADTQNRCDRCNRPLSDPDAEYGWRCAQILGVAANLNNANDEVWNAFLEGFLEANDWVSSMESSDFLQRGKVVNFSPFFESIIRGRLLELESYDKAGKELSLADLIDHMNVKTGGYRLTPVRYEDRDRTAHAAGIITESQFQEIAKATAEHREAEKIGDYAGMNLARVKAVAIRRIADENYVDNYDYTHGGRYVVPKKFVTANKVPLPASGYKAPKKKSPWDKEKKGWIDEDGNVWVYGAPHAGEHWDVQYKNGGYDNVYPDGTVRAGKGGRGKYSPVNVTVDAKDVIIAGGTAAGIAVGAYVIYQGVKWGVATVAAGPSGGISLGLAAILP